MPGDPTSLQQFAATFKAFLENVNANAPVREPVFRARLRSHFGQDPETLPVVSEEVAPSDHPNLQTALDAYLERGGQTPELVGINVPHRPMGFGLSDLAVRRRPGPDLSEAPVEYLNVEIEENRVLPCVQVGLYLLQDLAVLVRRRPPEIAPTSPKVQVEVMARRREEAQSFLAQLRALMAELNVYRGHVVSLSADRSGTLQVRFHRLSHIERAAIVLPEGVLERIERHALTFAAHTDKLLAAGRHIKRGMLLYGAPGTGKTLTAMYLAGRMRGRTVLLLTGAALGLIEQSCAMARALQPSTVVIEDVDLIAQERVHQPMRANTLLFELLNQMDGLAEDADVLFLLTTNRPDLLEPALAARPGRVDQAVELPMPDAEARSRLFRLYAQGLTLQVDRWDRLVERTEGASPAFIREMLRRAALLAVEESGEVLVEDRHLDDALHELVITGGELTKSLLGVRAAPTA